MAKKSTLDDVLLPMQKDIRSLNMNGLEGRMLRIASSTKKYKKNEIMLIYGSHASIERMYGFAKFLSKFGNVTLPDLPGCGGMQPLQKNGLKPTIDNLADYLASFVKLRYRNKKVTIIGMSLGFVVVTRMLQRYPELQNRVSTLISLAGFSNANDFLMSKKKRRQLATSARIVSNRALAWLYYTIALHPLAIKTVYARKENARRKLDHLTEQQRINAVEFEIRLWRENDARTYLLTSAEMLFIDNCTIQIPMVVHHVSVDNDQYFDNNRVEQHMRIIFDDFIEHHASMPNHAPSILADPSEASQLLPSSLQKVLRKMSNKS